MDILFNEQWAQFLCRRSRNIEVENKLAPHGNQQDNLLPKFALGPGTWFDLSLVTTGKAVCTMFVFS